MPFRLSEEAGLMPDRRARACAALFEHVPLAVALIDLDKSIVDSNAAFARTFGPPDGRKCYEVYKRRPEPCEDCPADLAFAGKQDGPSVTQQEGLDQTGSAIVYQLQTVPLPGERGGVPFVLAISADITGQLQLRKELRETERMAGVGLTVASMAHSIKNILTGLEGGTYMVSTGLQRQDQDRLVSGWGMVERYIQQISTLVRNLLKYGQAHEPMRSLTDPRALLEELVRFFAEEASRAGIKLDLRVDEGVTPLLLDPDLIHASLANLVANALDACTWDPDLEKPHQITVSALARDSGGVVFEVRDNGMGISEEDQKKLTRTIFTTKGIRGTGLGLLLTRKAVEEHGGTITFESTPGQGTTFRLALPGGAGGGKKSEGVA